MQKPKESPAALPDMSELKADSEAGKQALIDHTFGRMFSGAQFPQHLLLMPLEVNGVFLNHGIYVMNLFSFGAGLTRFNAITNLDKTYRELKELVSREFSRHCINYVFEENGVVVEISCYFIREESDGSEQQGPERLCRVSCERIMQEWRDLHNEDIFVASSDPFQGIDNLFSEYQRLIKEIEFRQYRYSGVRKVVPDTGALDEIDTYMHPLSDALDDCDLEKVRGIAETVLQRILAISPNTISDYDFRVHYFLFRLEQMLESKQMHTSTIHSKLRKICFAQGVEELAGALGEILAEAVRISEESRASSTGKTIQRIEQYVQENLTRQDFSIAGMASALNMSPAAISAKYRRAAGKRLIDYISLERIKVAEQLLVSTGESIRDIAEKAGYGSASSMYRAFKRYRGISPNLIRTEKECDPS